MFYYSTAHKEVPSLFCDLCVSPRPSVVSLAFFVSLVLRGDLKSRFFSQISWSAVEHYFVPDDPIPRCSDFSDHPITGSPDLKLWLWLRYVVSFVVKGSPRWRSG